MKIHEFIQQYSLDQIIQIEQSEDMQYLSLKNAWEQIKHTYGTEDHVISTYLWMIIQTSIVSYQIGGSGELRWTEFSTRLYKDFEIVLTLSDHSERWEEFLAGTAYNKRLPKMKSLRIKKLNTQRYKFFGGEHLHNMYHNMVIFNKTLAEAMQQKEYAKTITFGTKMFGYGCRIVFNEIVYFPYEVAIPVDSRLIKIYQQIHHTEEAYSNYIINRYNKLGEKYHIPPLHLDSLIWIKYRNLYFSKYRGAGTQHHSTILM